MVLPWVVNIVLDLPTPKQFRRLNIELQEAVKQKEAAIGGFSDTGATLRCQVDYLEHRRRTGLGVAEQELAIRRLGNPRESSDYQEATR